MHIHTKVAVHFCCDQDNIPLQQHFRSHIFTTILQGRDVTTVPTGYNRLSLSIRGTVHPGFYGVPRSAHSQDMGDPLCGIVIYSGHSIMWKGSSLHARRALRSTTCDVGGEARVDPSQGDPGALFRVIFAGPEPEPTGHSAST